MVVQLNIGTAGRDAGLHYFYEAAVAARKRYNDAVLSDKELLGNGWPLVNHPQIDYDKEVGEVAGEGGRQ